MNTVSIGIVEKWLPIENYETLYEVSNFGEVRSKDRKVWNGKVFYTKKGRVLKKSKTSTGYWKVELVNESSVRKSFKVHRLVANEFIEKVDGKTLINHIDGNPLNNISSNLEWCTQKENVEHAYKIGLNPSNLVSNKQKILEEYTGDSSTNVKQLARKYGCPDGSIRKLLKKNGIKIRGISQTKDIYGIDRKEMIEMFERGEKNTVIAKHFNTNRLLIATYKCKYKKGELIV